MSAATHGQRDRVIFFHKHGTSARTRFLRFADETVCGFSPLPRLAQLIEEPAEVPEQAIETHPAAQLREAAQRLELTGEQLEIEREYNVWIDVPGGPIRVILARFTGIDPPFDAAASVGARFIDLTEARDLPEVELLLLRKAYEVILGG